MTFGRRALGGILAAAVVAVQAMVSLTSVPARGEDKEVVADPRRAVLLDRSVRIPPASIAVSAQDAAADPGLLTDGRTEVSRTTVWLRTGACQVTFDFGTVVHLAWMSPVLVTGEDACTVTTTADGKAPNPRTVRAALVSAQANTLILDVKCRTLRLTFGKLPKGHDAMAYTEIAFYSIEEGSLATAVRAADQKAQDEAERILHRNWENAWVRKTEHFTIRTNHSKELADGCGPGLEQFRAYWLRTLFRHASDANVDVFIFRERDECSDYMRKLGLADRYVGCYVSERRLVLSGSTLDFVLRHEVTHQLLHDAMSHPPVWYSEGLAELLALHGGGDIRPEPQLIAQHLRVVRNAIKSGSWVALKQLLTLDYRQFHDFGGEYLHYAQSWAVLWFLDQHGRLEKFHKSMRSDVSGIKELEEIQGEPLDRIEPAIQEYLLRY